MNKRIIVVYVLMIVFIVCNNVTNVYASDAQNEESIIDEQEELEEDNSSCESDNIEDELDYDEIQETIDKSIGSGKIDFKEQIVSLLKGENMRISDLVNLIKECSVKQIKYETGIFVKIIVLGIVSAVFAKISGTFNNGYIAETGFNISYLMLFTILTASFGSAYDIASKTLELLLGFMKVIIPVYALSVTLSNGSGTGIVFYETAFVIIACADWIFLKVLLPCTSVYVLIVLANNISEEDILSQLQNVISKIVKWATRILLTISTGVQIIQKLIVPEAERAGKKIAQGAAGSVPVVGDTISSVSESVAASTIVLKNAVGVSGIIIIFIICLVPIIKLAVYVLTYGLAAAAVQPVSDGRIVKCVAGISEGTQLLMEITISGLMLFIITLGLVAG